MPDVACLGIFVADLLGRPIDALPPRGRLALLEEILLHIGGNAANTSIDLARLGVRVATLGKVGADGLGDFIVQTFERHGVDVRGVVRDGSASTAVTMVLVSSDGERTFLHHTGANSRYRAEDVCWPVIRESKILLVAGALLMPAFDGPPMADTLRRAKEMGLLTVLDVVWDATGQWMRTLAPCLPHTDYFLPNLAEAQALTGREYPTEAARALRDAGVKTVGLKLGEEGCYIQSSDKEIHLPAFRVPVVDGTGAGDAWDAGFLYGLLRGWDLERTARFANALGALCVTAMGATTGIRSVEETEAFLARGEVY